MVLGVPWPVVVTGGVVWVAPAVEVDDGVVAVGPFDVGLRWTEGGETGGAGGVTGGALCAGVTAGTLPAGGAFA